MSGRMITENFVSRKRQMSSQKQRFLPPLYVYVQFLLSYGARVVKDLMNCMIEPREPCLLNDRVIHVLWSRDSNSDSRPGVRYHSNHFVPLLVVSGEAVRSEKLDPQTESRGQLKITSLLKNKNISTTLDRKPASTTSCIPANNSVSKPASKVEPSSSVKREAVSMIMLKARNVKLMQENPSAIKMMLITMT